MHPFIDDLGIIRVGGRIGSAKIPFNVRHQIILPKKCHLTELIIAHTHLNTLHSGPQLTIATLRQNYWILSVRRSVKQHILRCPVCIRYKHTVERQLMAPLPMDRAFLAAGVDYAGPITIKLQPGRGTKTSKAYIALFVCLSTKALHLELVSSLTTESFLAAFRRFVSRRGNCAHLYSGCSTNFVGAAKELNNLSAVLMKQFKDTSIADHLATENTQWHFNPPGTLSFGCIYEAAVRSVKHHLRRVIGISLFTFEELITVLTQIEAILNSRPISPMSDDPEDYQVLTPGHILIGEPKSTIPDTTIRAPLSTLQRWQHLQQITQHFWQRWRQEYVTSLQQRHKWSTRTENMKLGSLALIVDELLPPARWTLGRIVELHVGQDV